MEYALDELEALVGVSQPISVSQEEYLSIKFNGLWLLVQDNAALFLQIPVCPDVVVAREVVHFHAHICQLRYFSEETGEALGNHIAVFVPEVEHIAQQVDGSGLGLDAVKEPYQPSLLHSLMGDGE